ncbi:MAG TPA: hypothetical protein PL033_12070 [Candidatus Brocadiia bacterium]|nr:hypothetical protein [Candidatus Brocadiia bacterium]
MSQARKESWDREQLDFKPGERYENRKGTYEVITISGDEMLIEYYEGLSSGWPRESVPRKFVLPVCTRERRPKAGLL